MTTILVVDDDHLMREQIIAFLTPDGYDILEAADGEEGIKQAIAHQPDLIICDVMMPKMNGYQFLERLYYFPPMRRIPFIFLTALADFEHMREGMNLGADDYLTKPFARQQLIDAIETRLLKQQEYLQGAEKRLNEVKKKIVKLVAHELRTPLAPIKMVTDLVTMKLGNLTDAELQDYMQVIRNSTTRMSHLVQQILLVTEIETGVIDGDSIMEKSAYIGAWDLVVSAIGLAREYAIRNEDVQIDMNFKNQDVNVFGVMPLLKHALSEIITNAMHFSKGNPVTIHQWYAEEEDTCWITVTDTGAGMSEETIDRAFREFEQINREKQEQQGIGLGLPLARMLVQMHEGTLKVKSKEGKGTHVTVGLPCYSSGVPVYPTEPTL
ncbi:MAG: hybrid sensor histidine kinase/response regulator [Chloroflexi bacterium]|nr:hybrid sensor histidine kinase/response regulator [Chloroflexota bacterium]